MQPPADNKYDVASYLSVGARPYQEDALASAFEDGAEFGIAVLADGMGGHAAGDVASKIVVDEVFGRLTGEATDVAMFTHRIHEILGESAVKANASIKAHVDENPEARGMGATLVATVFLHNQLYWISIGDSPLFLYRASALEQLNEDHSMAPQIDLLVRNGLMDPEFGRKHPDRSALTSVVIGDSIERIDCPDDPFRLETGDIVILCSDGLQYLKDDQIETVLAGCGDAPAAEIAEALGAALEDLDHPEQDNASFTIIRVLDLGENEETFDICWEEELHEDAEHSNTNDKGDERMRRAGGGRS